MLPKGSQEDANLSFRHWRRGAMCPHAEADSTHGSLMRNGSCGTGPLQTELCSHHSRPTQSILAPIPQLSQTVLPLPDKATSQSMRPPCPHSPDSPGRHLITCPTLCGEQTWRTLLSAAARHDQHGARIHPEGQRVTTALSRLERTKVTVLGSHTQDVLSI